MLFMIDTCQANTMYSKFYSPNILATGSSELDQSSYSHHADSDIGVAVIDRYTYYNLEYLENNVKNASSKCTMKDLFDSYDNDKINSTPGVREDLFGRNLEDVLITEFFGNVQNVEVDGEGEEGKWKVDSEELSRLAANISMPGRASQAKSQTDAKNTVVVKPPTRKMVAAVRVEEKGSWVQSAAAVGALLVCGVAWVAGSVAKK